VQPPDSPDSAASDRTDKSKNNSLLRGVLWTSLFVLVVAGSLVGWFAHYALSPGPQVQFSQSTVFIPKGASVEKIGDLLDSADLLEGDIRFLLLTKILGVSSKLPAGEFSLDANQNPMDLLAQLVEGHFCSHGFLVFLCRR